MLFLVHRIVGLTYGQYRQDVAFLESNEGADINAKKVFDGLSDKHQAEMRNKFELWQRGEQHVNKYFHGFNEIGYRECFVFKRKEAGTYHRFYGFLINPQPISNSRYRVCILVQHAQKNQEKTDLSELNYVNTIRGRPDAIAAVKKEFPEKPGGANVTLYFRK